MKESYEWVDDKYWKESNMEVSWSTKKKKAVRLKWVFKIKYNEDDNIQKHKARIVTKGYSQQPEVDFTKTFTPIVRMGSITLVLVLSAQLQFQVFQLDVKTTFLNGEL